jgi:radical SAM/Cys-rich protein
VGKASEVVKNLEFDQSQQISDRKSYNFRAKLEEYKLSLTPISIETLQVNVTRLCNQMCSHCRVDASPQRTEQMDHRTVDRCLEVLALHDGINSLDITGGAPELNPDFDYFVAESRKLDKKVTVRHNLTVTFDGNPQTGEVKTYLPDFFAEQKVEIIASMPHYQKDAVEEQRGAGVFSKSIKGLQLLNSRGYGKAGSALILNLVHNPSGALLPAEQAVLEAEFRRELSARYGVEFNSLYTMTNVPLKRFKEQLKRSGTYNSYMKTLIDAFNPAIAKAVMCRSTISADYSGRLYDCDINQVLDMQITCKEPMTVFNFDRDALMARDIKFATHCFACTAGAGSG